MKVGVDNSTTPSNPGELKIFSYQKKLGRRGHCETFILQATRTIRRGQLIRIPASCSRGSGFEPRPGKSSIWQVVFLFSIFIQTPAVRSPHRLYNQLRNNHSIIITWPDPGTYLILANES